MSPYHIGVNDGTNVVLYSLKSKYQMQTTKLRQSGGGIVPGNPQYANLIRTSCPTCIAITHALLMFARTSQDYFPLFRGMRCYMKV